MLRETLSYQDSILHLERIIKIYEDLLKKKEVYLQRGTSSHELDKSIEGILNDVQFITGERKISAAKKVLEQFENAKIEVNTCQN